MAAGSAKLQAPPSIWLTAERHAVCSVVVAATHSPDPLPGIWFLMQLASASSVVAVEHVRVAAEAVPVKTERAAATKTTRHRWRIRSSFNRDMSQVVERQL